MSMMQVNIYIKCCWKGSLRGSGRAAALIVYEDKKGNCHKKAVTTEVTDSTKERLHLQAVTKAVRTLKKECSIGIYIDNQFIKSAIGNGWVYIWQRNGWKSRTGKIIKNGDVWSFLVPMLSHHTVGIMPYIRTFDKELNEVLQDSKEIA